MPGNSCNISEGSGSGGGAGKISPVWGCAFHEGFHETKRRNWVDFESILCFLEPPPHCWSWTIWGLMVGLHYSELLLFSRSVVSLQPQGVQRARLPCLHYLLEFVQTHLHRVDDAIQPLLPLSPPSPPTLNLSQRQSLFQRRLSNWLWNDLSWLILISPTYRGFPGGSDSKESTCKAGDSGSIPGSGRSLEEGMATHSSILPWEIPRTKESGGLPSMGSQRVGHDRAANPFHFRRGASSGPHGQQADLHLDVSGLTVSLSWPLRSCSSKSESRAVSWRLQRVERAKEWSSLQLRAGKWQLASSLFGLISLGTFVKYYLLIRNVQNSPTGVGSSTLSALGGASKWREPLSSQRWCSLVWEIIM